MKLTVRDNDNLKWHKYVCVQLTKHALNLILTVILTRILTYPYYQTARNSEHSTEYSHMSSTYPNKFPPDNVVASFVQLSATSPTFTTGLTPLSAMVMIIFFRKQNRIITRGVFFSARLYVHHCSSSIQCSTWTRVDTQTPNSTWILLTPPRKWFA